MLLLATADDYGIAPATSATIRQLLRDRRLSGTSCMTVFPEWADEGAALRDIPAKLGVHLTLTDHPRHTGERSPSFPVLARRAHLRQLDAEAVRAELTAQLDAFEEAIGRPPDFLDGHHHVHQLPIIRDVVLALAARLAPGGWIRTCHETWTERRARPHLIRSSLFSAAAASLHLGCRHRGIRTNDGFAGIYDFAGPYDARPLLAGLRPHTAFMVHPGAVDDTLEARDSLTHQRQLEADYLASDAWPSLLDELGCVLHEDPAAHDEEVEDEAAPIGEGLGHPR